MFLVRHILGMDGQCGFLGVLCSSCVLAVNWIPQIIILCTFAPLSYRISVF